MHEVHCTEFSTHPSKMIAAWRSVNTLRIPLPYDVECVCKESLENIKMSVVFESFFIF